jgi:hypothetical protein
MARILPLIILVVLTVYCGVECAQSDRNQVRNLPKALWLVLIIILPLIGSVGWLLGGRPRLAPPAPAPGRRAVGRGPRGPVAPDDDPRFLARLDETTRDIQRISEWEADLRDPEPEVRKRDDEGDGPPR